MASRNMHDIYEKLEVLDKRIAVVESTKETDNLLEDIQSILNTISGRLNRMEKRLDRIDTRSIELESALIAA